MLEDEPEDTMRLHREIAYSQLEILLARELQRACAAYGRNASVVNWRWISEATILLEVIQTYPNVDLGDPFKVAPFIGLISAATGVIGFDEAGNARVEEDKVVPHIRTWLSGNATFQRLANEHLQQAFGAMLTFTHYSRRPPFNPEFMSNVLGPNGRYLN